MIVTVLLNLVFLVVDFIIGLLGVIPSFPTEMITSVETYIAAIIDQGAGLFFFLIRPQTFYIAIDVLFFLYAGEHIYYFVMWVLRKIPFLGVE